MQCHEMTEPTLDLKAGLMRELKRLQDIKLLVHDLWVYYREPIDEERLCMMAEDLADFEPRAVAQAIVKWRRTPPEKGHKPRAPMPCELIAFMQPKSTVDEEADLIAGDILAAVKSIGRNRPNVAERRLGFRAWQVVKARGGWDGLCSIKEDDLAVHHAQLRDLARATLRRDPMGLSQDERLLAAKMHDRTLPEMRVVADVVDALSF